MGEKLQIDRKLRESGETVARLADKLRKADVQALYLGDGNHHSTNVELHAAVSLVEFAPDLVFFEIGAERGRESVEEFAKQNEVCNHFYALTAVSSVGAKAFAVDDPEASKRSHFTAEVRKERLSLKTHGRIAGRIVDHLSNYNHEHGRLPKFVVYFGADHFRSRNDLDECVHRELEKRGLPVPKARSLELKPSQTEESKLHLNWFKDYDYSMEVNSVLPRGVPDLRNPTYFDSLRSQQNGR